MVLPTRLMASLKSNLGFSTNSEILAQILIAYKKRETSYQRDSEACLACLRLFTAKNSHSHRLRLSLSSQSSSLVKKSYGIGISALAVLNAHHVLLMSSQLPFLVTTRLTTQEQTANCLTGFCFLQPMKHYLFLASRSSTMRPPLCFFSFGPSSFNHIAARRYRYFVRVLVNRFVLKTG